MSRMAVFLAAAMTCNWASADLAGSWEIFEPRLQAMMAIEKDVLKNPIDAKEIIPTLKNNPAKAGLKYGKPAAYLGTVKRVTANNQSDADLILDAGGGNEITVVLFPVQPSAWTKDERGKWDFKDLEPTMEFAAKLDGGERFYFQCKKFVSVLGNHYLSDCLAFPQKVL